MSRFVKTHRAWLLPVVFLAVLLTLAVPAMSLRTRAAQPPQEITLVSRDVTFWLPDRPDEPNPPLHLTRGRTVRLILRNHEPDKVLHCFTIGGLGAKSTRDLSAGESEVITFTPDQSGTFTYACLMHPMMIGKVVVE